MQFEVIYSCDVMPLVHRAGEIGLGLSAWGLVVVPDLPAEGASGFRIDRTAGFVVDVVSFCEVPGSGDDIGGIADTPHLSSIELEQPPRDTGDGAFLRASSSDCARRPGSNSFIGPKPNLLDINQVNPPMRLEVSQPVLNFADMAKLRDIEKYTQGKFRSYTLDITYPLAWGREGVEAALTMPAGDGCCELLGGDAWFEPRIDFASRLRRENYPRLGLAQIGRVERGDCVAHLATDVA